MEKILNVLQNVLDVFKDKKGKRIINYIVTCLGIFFYLFFIVAFKVNYALLNEYICFLLIPIFMIFITNMLDKSKKETKKNYNLILIINLVFIGSLIYANTCGMKSGLYLNGIRYYNYNLVPFKTLKTILIDGVTYGIHDNLLLGNLLMFIGIAILLPLVNEKFKKTYLFIPMIIFLGFLYEGIEYIFMIGSFDIDMIILRTIGALIIFLIVYKTKLLEKLKVKLAKIKVNIKVLNVLYIGLFILLIIFISDGTSTYFKEKSVKDASISGLIKCSSSLNEVEVGVVDNYRYYTKCQGDYSIIYKNNKYTLLNFISETPDITKYMDKFKLRREKFITDVKVIENNETSKKLVETFNDIKSYYYNIDSIKVTVDNNTYNYEDYLQHYTPSEIDLNFTRKDFFRSNQDGYSFYTLEYYNNLYCGDSMYYLPKTYKITKYSCNYLEKLGLN